jgi:hypothetical protein
MSDVKRYRFGSQPFGKWVESDEGQWVRYDDYSALEAQLQKQTTLMDMGFAEYERRLGVSERMKHQAEVARLRTLKDALAGDKINLVSELRQVKAQLATARRDAWEEAAKVAAGQYRSHSEYDPESPCYGIDLSPDRSDFGRGIQRGREQASNAIRALIAQEGPTT